MDRRNFLTTCSVASLLKLGPISDLGIASNGVFESKSLKFALRCPKSWHILTFADQFDQHFTEWGGVDEDLTLPIAVFSKLREPTPEPNYAIQIDACKSCGWAPMDKSVASIFKKGFNEIVANEKHFIDVVDEGLDSSHLPFESIWIAYRASGVDRKDVFLGTLHLIYNRRYPLLLSTGMPENGDKHQLNNILQTYAEIETNPPENAG